MHEIVGRKAWAILTALEKGAAPASDLSELLCCPFCGGPAYILSQRTLGMDTFSPKCWKEKCCGNARIAFETQEKAIEAWNLRAT